MPILIPIDPASVRRNPDYDKSGVYQVAGRSTFHETKIVHVGGKTWRRECYLGSGIDNGVLQQPMMVSSCETDFEAGVLPDDWKNTIGCIQHFTDLYVGGDSRPWLWQHVPTTVTCESCKANFLHIELETDDAGDDEDYYWSDRVCPRCHAWNCCEVTYEAPDFAKFAALVAVEAS